MLPAYWRNRATSAPSRLRCGSARRNFTTTFARLALATDRRGPAGGEQRNIAAAGELVSHLDRIDLDGAGSGSHADSTHQRRLRNCQRRDALQAARHYRTEARRAVVTCGGRAGIGRATQSHSSGNGGDTAPAYGRRHIEWDRATSAA